MPDNAPDSDAATGTPAPAPASNASASAPAEPTSNAPTSNTLTPPTAAPAQPPLNLQPTAPEKPGEHWKNLSRAAQAAVLAVHAFIPNQVVDGYDTDADGKMTPRVRKLGGMDRVKMIASAALQGLAAGAAVHPQKSGAASALSGLGAGFVAQQRQAQQEDLLKRQQGKEQYEMEQKTLMDKAVRASHNASTYSLMLKNADDANAHDMERAKNMDLVNAAKDYISRNPGTDMQVQILTPEEAKAIRDTDTTGHAIGLHTFLPVGMKVIGEGENAKQVGQVAVISGGNQDGKIPLPQSFIDDLKTYGKLAGIAAPEQYKAGMEIPLLTVAAMDRAMNPAKEKEQDAWKTAKDIIDPKTGQHMQQNEYTNATRPYPAGMQPNVKNEPAESAADIKLKGAEAEDKLADAAKKRADATGKNDKPVYAYNHLTKQLEQTTRNEIAQYPGVYTNPVDIKESDIRKDQDLARQLGDAQLNLSRYRAAAAKMDDPSFVGLGALGGSKRAMAALLGDDRFKLQFMGAEVPTDWMNKLLTSSNWQQLSKPQQDALIGYIGARGAVIAYQKAVSGSGRANKEQLVLELQNIPSPLLAPEVREKQFERFQQNIDQTGAGLPKMVGVDRPQEIRQKIETEEAKRAGATHVYEASSGQAIPVDSTPVKNIFGKVIGYKDAHDRVTMFPRQ